MTNRTDTEGGAMTLEKGLAAFLEAMLGRNRSTATLRAYRTDVLQFITFLHENNVAITGVGDVGKVDVLEYLAALARKGLTGVARARKVSAIREYFRFLEGVGVIERSPVAGIDTPKREKHTRQFLRSDEYTKMLSLAGGNPRDYAILQEFLQTGIRESELASLALGDVDFIKPAIRVRGKGNQEREIALARIIHQPKKSTRENPFGGQMILTTLISQDHHAPKARSSDGLDSVQSGLSVVSRRTSSWQPPRADHHRFVRDPPEVSMALTGPATSDAPTLTTLHSALRLARLGTTRATKSGSVLEPLARGHQVSVSAIGSWPS